MRNQNLGRCHGRTLSGTETKRRDEMMLRWYRQGYTATQIAASFGLSPSTAGTRLRELVEQSGLEESRTVHDFLG